MNEMEWHLLEDKPAIESVAVAGVEIRKGASRSAAPAQRRRHF